MTTTKTVKMKVPDFKVGTVVVMNGGYHYQITKVYPVSGSHYGHGFDLLSVHGPSKGETWTNFTWAAHSVFDVLAPDPSPDCFLWAIPHQCPHCGNLVMPGYLSDDCSPHAYPCCTLECDHDYGEYTETCYYCGEPTDCTSDEHDKCDCWHCPCCGDWHPENYSYAHGCYDCVNTERWDRYGERKQRPTDVIPGWIERNDPLPETVCEAKVYQTLHDEAKAMELDPVRCMADFYLLDFLALALARRYRYGTTCQNDGLRDAHLLKQDVKRLQDALVARCDGLFQTYLFAAIGGEVRYHPNVQQTNDEFKNGRATVWNYWCAMGECGDRLALAQDCVELFSDKIPFPKGTGVGGDNWAQIARTLVGRLDGTLDAATFVDRVFNLQHNGGMALNKVKWHSFCGHDIRHCRYIGDAHHSRRTNFGTLVEVASEDVLTLTREIVKHHSFGHVVGLEDAYNDLQAVTVSSYDEDEA